MPGALGASLQLSWYVLVEFLSRPAAAIHYGLPSKSGKQSLAGIQPNLFGLIYRRDPGHGFPVTGNQVATALANSLKDPQEVAVSLHNRDRLFHGDAPGNQRSDIQYFVIFSGRLQFVNLANYRGRGKFNAGPEKHTPGAKALVISAIYGPTKVVP